MDGGIHRHRLYTGVIGHRIETPPRKFISVLPENLHITTGNKLRQGTKLRTPKPLAEAPSSESRYCTQPAKLLLW
jgi:hypothetical protein